MTSNTGDNNRRPAYTQRFWAKSDRENPGRIHLLEHHLADVGACFEALLTQPTIRRRMARAGGRDDLDDATAARLAVFAALHDIGKVNIGFQTQIWTDADRPSRRWMPRAGHTSHLLPVLTDDDYETAGWFFDALGWWDDFLTWDDQDGAAVCGLLLATLSHHGRPLQLDNSDISRNTALWQPYGDLRPQEFVARMGQLLRKWFPDAFAPDAPPLPAAPAFQHHFLGLCNLADWIGSNEKWFPYEDAPDDGYIVRARERARDAVAQKAKAGLDIRAQRAAFDAAAVPDFATLFAVAEPPRAIQKAAAQDTPLDAPVVIIESETGSGKTEAALWRFARMYAAGLVDGLYFALPTRAAARQIHGRVEQFVARLFPMEHCPKVALAVPGYDDDGGLPDYSAGYDTGQDGHYDGGLPWAAEWPKKFLTAQFAVGTVDQAMLGALMVKNAHLRSSSLARNLLVVDEVHASDVYMGVVLQRLLAAHTGAGGYALLMSATLGSAARERWLNAGANAGAPEAFPDLDAAIATNYPAVSAADGIKAAGENGQRKVVNISVAPEMGDFDAVACHALDAARAGAKVLVVRNTVGYAINTQQRVAELAGDGITTMLHHGRYAAGDRKLLDGQVVDLLGKDRDSAAAGVIVVGTQTLEQSLDIDADLLITDLCPVDVLLQRIGRLHRHSWHNRPEGYDKPHCIALTPSGGDLTPLLKSGQRANGLGPHGGVYRNLHILEATRRLLDEHRVWRIPEMNRELVERATHPAELDAITQKMGEAWQEHAVNTEGGHIADRQTAHGHAIRFGRAFFPEDENRAVVFPDKEENIRTRLGDERVEIAFDPHPPSPLDGRPIDRIGMPLLWLGGAEMPKDAITTVADGAGGFEFGIGSRRFRYDRQGLQRAN